MADMSSIPHDVTITGARLVEADFVRAKPLHLAAGRVAAHASPTALSLDLTDHLIFPGLINAHDHLQLNCIPPLRGEGRVSPEIQNPKSKIQNPDAPPFPNSYCWMDAFQPHRADPTVAAACAVPSTVRHWHGGLKNLLCGVTTVAHHDPYHPSLDDPAFPVRVLRDFGWSHSLGLGLANLTRSALRYGPEVRESFAATPAGQPWIIHLAEGTDAIAATELTELDSLGCLAANTVLVHGVGLTEDDVTRVVAQGAGVIWCPGSNLALLGRTLSPRRLLNAGRLALGTDSRLAGSFDLLEDLRLAAEHSDCSPAELLALVTTAASRLLCLPDVGSLSPGQRGDLLIVRDTGHAPYRALLQLHRAEIRAVVRDGVPAIADPDFAEWFAVCGIQTTSIRLDGRPKLCAQALLGPTEAAALEPGLEVDFGF
jgi:cytosine/adenosine deaminase-related metal-dependent hydrolase